MSNETTTETAPETTLETAPATFDKVKEFFAPLGKIPKGLASVLAALLIVVVATGLVLVAIRGISEGMARGISIGMVRGTDMAREAVDQQNAGLAPYVTSHEFVRADLVQVIHPDTPRWLCWVWATPRIRQGLATEVLKSGQVVAHWANGQWVPGPAPALGLPQVPKV